MKKNKLKRNIILFSVIFSLAFIKTKLTGDFGRIYYGPISYKETFEKIPGMLVFSVVILLLGNIIDKEREKAEEMSKVAARKRIKEREKEMKEEEKNSSNNESKKVVE